MSEPSPNPADVCPLCGEPIITKHGQTTHTVAGRGERWQGTLAELINCNPDPV